MPGIDSEFCSHHLNIYSRTKPVAQKKCKLGSQQQAAAATQVSELLKAGIVQEIQYATWLANFIMVQKKDKR